MTIGQFHLSSTMGKGVPVDIGTVDPSSSRFMLVERAPETLVEKSEGAGAATSAHDVDAPQTQKQSAHL